MRTIVKYPDPILLKPAEDFNFETDRPLLKEFMAGIKGGTWWGSMAGMAAPQLGISKRFFIAQEKMYINPTITEYSKETFVGTEGCYSLEEGKSYEVTRSVWVRLKWQDRGQNWHEKRFERFTAEVIQHEYDHLMGKLCSKQT